MNRIHHFFCLLLSVGSISRSQSCSISQDDLVTCLGQGPFDFFIMRKRVPLKDIYELDSLLDLCSGKNKKTITTEEILACTADSCLVREWTFQHFCAGATQKTV